jgi:pimeloyl-ACP methyl ester carboxylesterase
VFKHSLKTRVLLVVAAMVCCLLTLVPAAHAQTCSIAGNWNGNWSGVSYNGYPGSGSISATFSQTTSTTFSGMVTVKNETIPVTGNELASPPLGFDIFPAGPGTAGDTITVTSGAFSPNCSVLTGTFVINKGVSPFEQLGTGTFSMTNQVLVTLLDPIPALISPCTSTPCLFDLTPDLSALGSQGNVIMGTSADGAAKVVIKISGLAQNQAIALNLINDQENLSTSPADDGGLGLPGATSFTANSLTLTAQPVGNTYMAFAVYSPPTDFARPTGADDVLVNRPLTLQTIDSAGHPLSSALLTLFRPPVLFVHGVWSSGATWSEFQTNMQADLPGLFTCEADYGGTSGDSVAINTKIVLPEALKCLTKFKSTFTISAGQLDFIVHSMGGLVSNNMPQFPGFFFGSTSYGLGYIHKLITIDTPYFGSPFALYLGMASQSCKNLFAYVHQPVAGAVTDLTPGSALLNRLMQGLPTGYWKFAISGQLSPTQVTSASNAIDFLAKSISACASIFNTPQTAPPNFNFSFYFETAGDPYAGANDMIVAVRSQLGLLQNYSHMISGFAHLSLTMIPAGYPGVLDAVSPNADYSVGLLNDSVSSGVFLH